MMDPICEEQSTALVPSSSASVAEQSSAPVLSSSMPIVADNQDESSNMFTITGMLLNIEYDRAFLVMCMTQSCISYLLVVVACYLHEVN